MPLHWGGGVCVNPQLVQEGSLPWTSVCVCLLSLCCPSFCLSLPPYTHTHTCPHVSTLQSSGRYWNVALSFSVFVFIWFIHFLKKKITFIFNLFIWLFCLHVYCTTYACLIPQRPKEGVRSFGIEVMNGVVISPLHMTKKHKNSII